MKKLLLISFLATSALSAQTTLLVSYDFNAGTGSAITNAGTVGASANLNLVAPATWGSGVSGTLGDFSYDNSTIINRTDGGGGFTAAPITALDELTSFSITSWIKQDTLAGNLARVVDWREGSPDGGVALWNNSGNRLELKIRNTAEVLSSNDLLENGNWVFVAVTYDAGTGVANFYKGNTTTATALFSSGTTTAPTTGTTTSPLIVGNRQGSQRAFDGALDNMRIYSGVLDLAGAEAVRLATVVPEPSFYALFGASTALGILLLRRNKRNA